MGGSRLSREAGRVPPISREIARKVRASRTEQRIEGKGAARLRSRPRRAVVADAEPRASGSRRLPLLVATEFRSIERSTYGGPPDPPRSGGEGACPVEPGVAAAAGGRGGVGLPPAERDRGDLRPVRARSARARRRLPRARAAGHRSHRRRARGGAAPRARDDDRHAPAFPARCGPTPAPDRGPRGRAGEADRTGRPGREADDDRVEPAPGRLDRQKVPPPGPPVPRSDPGGNARTDSRGREVRLAPGVQVLDLRDLVDQPGGGARARGQGADDPDAGAHRRADAEAEPRRADALDGARARADAGGGAEGAGLPPRQALEVEAAARASISLDQPLGEQQDALFGDMVAEEGPLPEERVEDTLRNEALAEALAILGERERAVIVLRYGLYASEPKTLAEIGRLLGISRERVRQLETEALKRLAPLRETEWAAG